MFRVFSYENFCYFDEAVSSAAFNLFKIAIMIDLLRSLVADFTSCDAASDLLAELEDDNDMDEENEDDDELDDIMVRQGVSIRVNSHEGVNLVFLKVKLAQDVVRFTVNSRNNTGN